MENSNEIEIHVKQKQGEIRETTETTDINVTESMTAKNAETNMVTTHAITTVTPVILQKQNETTISTKKPLPKIVFILIFCVVVGLTVFITFLVLDSQQKSEQETPELPIWTKPFTVSPNIPRKQQNKNPIDSEETDIKEEPNILLDPKFDTKGWKLLPEFEFNFTESLKIHANCISDEQNKRRNLFLKQLLHPTRKNKGQSWYANVHYAGYGGYTAYVPCKISTHWSVANEVNLPNKGMVISICVCVCVCVCRWLKKNIFVSCVFVIHANFSFYAFCQKNDMRKKKQTHKTKTQFFFNCHK